jgi:phenylpropionate dioxygenase-like ring-hydroxylating dioxygenase large terminal subunit
MFVRNAWYAAAWDRELTDGLLPIKVLGENIVLYRQSNGAAAALEDACAHRKVPLSMGRIRGDHVECGYHGLRFAASGECVHIPCSERVPKAAKVRSFPMESRYGLLWIWMGDPQAAQSGDIMEVAHWDDPLWSRTGGDSMVVDCNYLYVTDNLLDPSHVAWVHPSSFGDAACQATPVQVKAYEAGVYASRWMHDAPVAPLYRRFVRFEGTCDRLQHYEVRFPCHAVIKAIFVPAGTSHESAATNDAAFIMDSYNFLTPVDQEHTRYFWFQVHNSPSSDADASRALAAGVKGAFEEDRVILNAVQKGFARSRTGNIDLPIDSAPLRFRRLVRKLIDHENSAAISSTTSRDGELQARLDVGGV